MATIISVDTDNGEVIVLLNDNATELTIQEVEGQLTVFGWRGRRPTESQISMACRMAAEALAEEGKAREIAGDIKKPRPKQLILF